MKTFWDPRLEQELSSRIQRLEPGSRAHWGRMTCLQMIVHVTDALACYMGELPTAGKWTPLRYAPLKQACVYLLPFPKNVPTAPELIARAPREWSEEMARLQQTMKTFAARRGRSDWPPHPLFGRLSARAYGVLAFRHTDHHLRQFGV